METVRVLVQGEPTSVVKCGEPDPEGILLLIIPGNPGIAGYYDKFQRRLWEHTDKKIPIWCMSHVGHVEFEDHSPDWKNSSCYGLKGQISHKLEFIRENIPSSTKLVLMGHSIGAYIVLELLDSLGDQVIQSCLLFPTIEYMAVTDKGTKFVHLLKYLRWLAFGPLFLLQYTPLAIKRKIIQWFVFRSDEENFAAEATLNLFSPFCVSNVLYMANEEFEYVQEANHDVIQRYLSKIMIYYGEKDHWCPLEYAHRMKNLYPEGNIILCDKGFAHAFILSSGEPMADVLWDWLKENCEPLKQVQ